MEKVLLDANENILQISDFWFKTDDGMVDVTSPQELPERRQINVKDILTVTQYMVDRHGKLIEVWGFDEEVTPF
jgi:hypothetical protein